VKLLMWRRRQDAELDEELESHLRMAIQDRIERGESPDQAAAAARREFGNLLLVRETARDTWGWTRGPTSSIGSGARRPWKGWLRTTRRMSR
jgi:hypothetical protein